MRLNFLNRNRTPVSLSNSQVLRACALVNDAVVPLAVTLMEYPVEV